MHEGIAEVDWRIEPARSGDPTLLLGERYVHSRYDPVAEARSLAERAAETLRKQGSGFALLIGAGLGYLPRALRERTGAAILLWDPFPKLSQALSQVSKPLRPGSHIRRVEDAAAFMAALGPMAQRGAPHLVVHPGYEELCRFEARCATWALRRVFQASRPLWIEEATVSRRSLDALARFPYLSTLERLGGCLEDRSVAVVSAGPSLDAALPALARRSGGVVMAAVQALRKLHEAGVRVDFVVAPDPGDYGSDLAGFEPRFGALLADTAVDPALLDRWPERTFLFHLRSPHLQHVAWEASGLPILDEPFVTVSEIGLGLAQRLGARRFVLCGVDLRSDDARYPVRFWTRDRNGSPTRTNSTYFHAARYLDAVCPALERAGCEVWRVGDGLPVHGTRPLAPERIVEMLDASPGVSPGSFAPPRRGVDNERWKRAHDLIRSVASGAGSHRWSTPRASGTHPDALGLDPLAPEERPEACRTALTRLQERAPEL